MNDQRGNDADPELGAFQLQIAEGLPELRVDSQTPVDFFQGIENLLAQSALARPGYERPESLANLLGIGNPIWNRGSR